MESSVRAMHQPTGEEGPRGGSLPEFGRPFQLSREKPGISLVVGTSVELETYAYHEDPYDAPGVNILNAEPDPMGRI